MRKIVPTGNEPQNKKLEFFRKGQVCTVAKPDKTELRLIALWTEVNKIMQ